MALMSIHPSISSQTVTLNDASPHLHGHHMCARRMHVWPRLSSQCITGPSHTAGRIYLPYTDWFVLRIVACAWHMAWYCRHCCSLGGPQEETVHFLQQLSELCAVLSRVKRTVICLVCYLHTVACASCHLPSLHPFIACALLNSLLAQSHLVQWFITVHNDKEHTHSDRSIHLPSSMVASAVAFSTNKAAAMWLPAAQRTC